jgi:hypothetical protein
MVISACLILKVVLVMDVVCSDNKTEMH